MQKRNGECMKMDMSKFVHNAQNIPGLHPSKATMPMVNRESRYKGQCH